MTPLSGLGIWIWQWSQCEGGDIDRILARAAKCGVRWIAVKAGEASSNGQVTRTRAEQCAKAGVTLAAWWYSRPTTTKGELDLVKALKDVHGIEHFIQDAEIEWETSPLSSKASLDWRPQGRLFAEQLRRTLGDDIFIADAPWAKPKAHPWFPLQEFGAVMNTRMPQFYWGIAGQSFSKFLTEADRQWLAESIKVVPATYTNIGLQAQTFCPIGSSVNFSGTLHSPISEFDLFLDYAEQHPAWSLWSWQHISPAEWGSLENRVTIPSASPTDKTMEIV